MFCTIISTAELRELQVTDGCIIFDCRFSLMQPEKGAQDFAKSRIPGSHYANLDTDLAGVRNQTSGRHPLPNKDLFLHWLQQTGLRKDRQVVVYDDAGGAIGARMWWMIRWAGYENVALLDGGWQEWNQRDLPLDETVVEPVETTAAQPEKQPEHKNLVEAGRVDWLTTDQLQQAISANEIKIVDARDAKRFSGEEEPIDPVAGHIPGAFNRPFLQNLNKQKLFKSPAQLRQAFSQYANSANEAKYIVHSCGSGVTACHNLLAMEHSGLSGSKLYVGSWSEWIVDASRPVATGCV